MRARQQALNRLPPRFGRRNFHLFSPRCFSTRDRDCDSQGAI